MIRLKSEWIIVGARSTPLLTVVPQTDAGHMVSYRDLIVYCIGLHH